MKAKLAFILSVLILALVMSCSPSQNMQPSGNPVTPGLTISSPVVSNTAPTSTIFPAEVSASEKPSISTPYTTSPIFPTKSAEVSPLPSIPNASVIPTPTQAASIKPTTAPETPTVISPPPTTAAAPVVTGKVTLLYFHPAVRCSTCQYFEERIRFAIASYFQQDLSAGRLELKLYNHMDQANAELVRKYKIVGSQLVISTTINGVENIRTVWEIYQWGSNKDAFAAGLKAIIEESIRSIK